MDTEVQGERPLEGHPHQLVYRFLGILLSSTGQPVGLWQVLWGPAQDDPGDHHPRHLFGLLRPLPQGGLPVEHPRRVPFHHRRGFLHLQEMVAKNCR